MSSCGRCILIYAIILVILTAILISHLIAYDQDSRSKTPASTDVYDDVARFR